MSLVFFFNIEKKKHVQTASVRPTQQSNTIIFTGKTCILYIVRSANNKIHASKWVVSVARMSNHQLWLVHHCDLNVFKFARRSRETDRSRMIRGRGWVARLWIH